MSCIEWPNEPASKKVAYWEKLPVKGKIGRGSPFGVLKEANQLEYGEPVRILRSSALCARKPIPVVRNPVPFVVFEIAFDSRETRVDCVEPRIAAGDIFFEGS